MSKKSISRRNAIKNVGLAVGGLSLSNFTNGLPVKEIEDSNEMKGKVAFITGGARGIGLAIATALAQKGVHCVLYDIAENISSVRYDLASSTDLNSAKKSIESIGVKCLTFKGDVRKLSELQNAVDATIKKLGRLDYVVANAGVTRNGDLIAHTQEDISDLMNVNIGGVINTINASSKHLIAQKSGRIISISSIAGRRGYGAFPVYGATKWAVCGLAKSVAADFGKHGVTSNVICPGFIDTALLHNDHMLQVFGDTNNKINEERFRGFARSTNKLPIDFMKPTEIAKMVSYLCDESGKYITGEIFTIDAGNTL